VGFFACGPLTLVAVLAAASDVAEGQADANKAPSVRITAGEVEITGPLAVKSASNIKNIGQGHVQVCESPCFFLPTGHRCSLEAEGRGSTVAP